MNMRIKEKSLTLLLSAAMVLATIPFGSMVAYADAPVTSGLSINAQSVYNAGNTADYDSTDLASNQSGSGWAWDASSGILTLDGFNGSYIEAIGGITIKLKGTNTITMAADGPSNGIKATGDIVFEKDSSSATDKLNVGVSGATALRYMLNTTGTIQINGGSLSLIETGLSGYVAGSDRPVYVNNDANLKASVSFRAVNSAVYCYGKGTVDLECTSTAADSKIVNSIYGNSTAGNEGGQIILSGNGLIANQYADFDTIQNSRGVKGYKGTITLHFPNGIANSEKMDLMGEHTLKVGGTDVANYIKNYYIGTVYVRGYYLVNTDKTVITDATIVYEQGKPLTVMDMGGTDHVSGLVVGKSTNDQASILDYVKGGSGSYYFYKDSSNPPPAGTNISRTYGYLSGTPTEETPAGSYRVKVQDDAGNFIYKEITYDAVAPTENEITVDGTTFVVSENKSGSGWSYNSSTKILTLDDYSGQYIKADGNLAIHLTGANSIDPSSSSENSAIYSDGSVTITADSGASLSVSTGTVSGDIILVDTAGGLIIQGGTIDISDGDGTGKVMGVEGNVTLFDDANFSMTSSCSSGINNLLINNSGSVSINMTKTEDPDDKSSWGYVAGRIMGGGTGNVDITTNGFLADTQFYMKDMDGGEIELNCANGIANKSGDFTFKSGYKIEGLNNYIVNYRETGNQHYIVKSDLSDITYAKFVYSAGQALTIMDMSSENNSTDKKITGWTVGTAIGNTPLINNYVRGGSGKYTYSIDSAHPLPAGLSIDSNKGTVSGTPTAMVAKSPTPYYTVVVTDQSSPAQTASVNVYYDGVAGNAPVSSVDITKDGYSSSGIVMVEGEEVQLGAKVLPEDAADKTVTWSVDGNYLTITADGKVGTKSTIVFPAGESTVRENVTVRTNSGGKTDSITVIVVKKEQTPTGVVNDCGTAIMMLDPNSTYYIQSGLSVNTFTTDANGCYTIENKYRNSSCTIRKKSPVSSEYYGMIGDPTSEPQTISIPATVTHDWSSFVIDTNTSGPGTEGEISKHCRHNFCDERSEITTIYEPAKATGLEWDGKIAKWNAVPHADAYWVTLYKASDDTGVKLYTNITDTQCDFSSDISSSTNYYFKVQAVSKNADILGTIFQRETMSEKSPIYGAQTHYDANGLWRRAGAGRYETSLLIAADYVEQKGGKLDTVVIASGEDFPDALGGGYLAIVNDAPLITVGPNSNVSSQTNVINFLKANAKAGAKVYILGGTGAVSQSFENKVKSAGFTVERCSGRNRYDTNIDTLKKSGIGSLVGGEILVSSGNGYADSLSASSTGKPMLLTNNTLTTDQINYLKSLKTSGAITSCKIIGGTGAVSTSVENQLKSIFGTSNVGRLQGLNRYQTSKAVAEYCISVNGISKPDQIVLAYAYNFPDGLSVGPFAYKLQAGTPLILAVNNTTAINAAAPTVKGWGTNKAYITGGPTLISDATAKAILK